jgi:hypothetical protein
MNLIEPIPPSLQRRLLAWSLAFGLTASLAASLAACAGHPPADRRGAIPDLDSLHRVMEYNDSVDANYFFYEDAFMAYRAEFPGVDKPAYMAVARGKDQAFCLFQPDPGRLCLDIGDKFKALGLGEPARGAYEAGLLSEGMNGDTLNIRLWSGMAELHLGWGERKKAMSFLTKVLEVDGKNKRARKMMESMTSEALDAETTRKPAVVPPFPGLPGTGMRQPQEGRKIRSRERIGHTKVQETIRNRPIGG